MNAREFVKKIKNKEIDVVEHTHRVIEECEKINKEYNYFNVISEGLAIETAKRLKKGPKGKLAGLPVSVKDCIVVKDIESRAGSKILNGYYPVFDATVVERIKKEGAIIIGKTSQDSFGFGGFSINADFGIPKNPFDKTRVCGGSSGGSGGLAQKATFSHVSLAESTGGSIVNPASFCGVVGLCPTYGRASRYGLMDYANSLDKIGPIAKTVEDCALVLEVISGFDENESTTLNEPTDNYTDFVNKEVKNMKIGLIKESVQGGVDKAVVDRVYDGILKLESEGAEVEKVSLPLTAKYGIQTYYLIAMSEASTNLAKYCGMRYGVHEKLEGGFNEYFSKVRSHNFNDESKRRIIIGTFARMAGFRDAYYIKAMRVRTKIINEYKKLFEKYDCLISPTMPVVAPKFSEIEKLTPLQNYMMDILTVGPNLAGLPHMNINIGFKDKLPVGVLLIADHLQEKKLVQIGGKLNV